MADYTSKYKGEQIDEAVGKALVGGAGAVTSVNGQTGAVQLDIPDVPDWAMQTKKPTYTASEVGALPSTYKPPDQTAEQVGADPAGTAVAKVDGHNEDESAHGDIRELITTLTQRLNAIADSDDVSLDQLSEIVTYIKNNKSIIDSIAIDKLSATDVVNNLTSNVTNKPLAAAQGVALKKLVDAISVPTKVSQLTNDSGYLTNQSVGDVLATAKESGEFDGVGVANIYQKTTSLTDGGENVYVVELTDGTVSNFKVRNGSKGSTGAAGKDGVDGTTPVKGTDYWTDADKAEFSEYIAAELAKRGQLKPEFAQSEEWLNANGDTSKLYVLPDGMIWANVEKTTTTEGGSIPNFTNLLNAEGAYTKPGLRYSQSGGTWKDNTGGTGYIIPIPRGSVTLRIKNYHWHNYSYLYAGTTNTEFPGSLGDTSAGSAFLAALQEKDKLITLNFTNNAYDYATFVSKDGYVEIITANEEITYTPVHGGTVTTYQWASTGHAFIPADYEDRIVELEAGLADAEQGIEALQNKVGGMSMTTNATAAFSVPAYCPVPQLPADGSEGSDFDYKSTDTQDAYDYMDALCGKYTQYITKQTMGKDASGAFDHNRYILSKAYWRAWQRENYPRMYAWINGSTVIYSVSVSPRVGDTMYSTPYVGTVYKTVTAVNSAAKTASTRTVNGLVFTRHESGDAEPTIAYTKPPQYPGNFNSATVYNSSFGSLTKVSTVGSDYFVGTDGIKYLRYPFEDRREDKTKPLSIFILSNEHGNYGDDQIPSYVVMRMARDLCKNTENPFLKWMKENCSITMIPVGNPWGYARYLASGNTTGYCNSNAVNINRNYDTPGWETSNTDPQGGTKEDGAFGAYPGSEIETQHIMNTMRLCKPKVGISMHSPGFAPQYKDTPDNAYFIHQGNGYDVSRINRITEALYSNYGMGGSADVGATQDYMQCGKSPAYIQYVGAVGGLTETVTQENNTNNIYTSIAMEQAYTQMLLFLQTWCEEALEKLG